MISLVREEHGLNQTANNSSSFCLTLTPRWKSILQK